MSIDDKVFHDGGEVLDKKGNVNGFYSCLCMQCMSSRSNHTGLDCLRTRWQAVDQ